MGVHGLWQLLAASGRRVDVESLAGKRVAVDISIWLVQFLKAMRDEQETLYRMLTSLEVSEDTEATLREVRPVFVFDGGAPVLKRKTLLARSKRRQRAEFGLEETARQLLQNQLQQQAALAVVKSREPSFNAPREDVRSDHGVTVVRKRVTQWRG